MSAVWAWLGIWSLASGWLLLVEFFLAPDSRGWALAAAGVLLLVLALRRVRWRRIDAWLYVLALPLIAAALIWPLPHKAGPLLALAGLLLALPLRRASWLTPLSLGLALAGAIWIAQSGAIVAYWWLAARYHEATFLAPLIHALTGLLGWTAGSSEGALFVPHVHGIVQATPTWERLGALQTMLMAAGGLALSPLVRWGGIQRGALRLAAALALGTGYLLARYLILTAILAITQNPSLFWLPWPTVLSFLPLSQLMAQVLPLRQACPAPVPRAGIRPARRYATLAGLAFLAGLAVVGILTFPDPGRPKAGRVLLDEYNSNWEWTTQALDTEWYGQKSGYNYYSLGQWLKYYFQVDTNFEPRTADLLSNYDVLIIKTPTAPFTQEEVDAIEAWVQAGGGLFLIGDHTNVFGTSSYLNPLARRFGLRFRYDSTYDLPTLRVTLYERPELLAHPSVVEMPPFLFATSCTLEAPLLAESVMTGCRLRALPVDYSNRVFFPDKEKAIDYPFGLFLQSAAVSHGKGRVVAFTDSTVFSNFTMFIAGKSEYFMGVMNWLNHAERWPWLNWVLMAIAVLSTAGAIWLARTLDRMRAGATILGALLLAAALGPWASIRLAEAQYPLPDPHTEYTRIAFDQEHSLMSLPTVQAANPAEISYQTFYVWTQRLGYVPTLAPTLEDALELGQVVALINPYLPFSPAEIAAIEEYVAQGGRLLVLAEPRQAGQSPIFANQVLAPFGLGLATREAETGEIQNTEGESLGQLAISGMIAGGEPLLLLKGQVPIVSLARHGEGLVVAGTVASTFTDQNLGTTAVIPNAHQRFLYDLEFWLFRGLVEGEYPPLRLETGNQ